jgi:CRISPR-associated endoribonuclease Cas6
MAMSPNRTRGKKSPPSGLTWPADTELVGLVLELTPCTASYLYAQYAIGLHAWLLGQIQQTDPDLSQLLHDEQSEKAFTISGLEGDLLASGKDYKLAVDRIYRWYITGLSMRVVQWLNQWVQNLPEQIDLRNAPLLIRSWDIAFAPTTYLQLLTATPVQPTVKLSFTTPTSFRSKGHHFPLPVPENVFHSYLRRWNNFSGVNVDQDEFLNWIEENAIIIRHKLESQKVAAGKKGMVTGFTGAVEFGLGRSANNRPDFVQLFYALGRLAPYCGTGHKTTFGLGQTRAQWLTSEQLPEISIQSVLAARIDELTEKFMALRKRAGGSRATEIAETWATILARRELGESLFDIAADLEMPYETVKTYVKLARRALKVDS